MRELLVKALRPLIVGVSLWLAIFGGSWAAMRWLAKNIQDRIEMAAGLDRDIEDGRRTLAQLEVDTWRIVVPRDQRREVRGGAGGRTGRSALEGGRAPGLEAVERSEGAV